MSQGPVRWMINPVIHRHSLHQIRIHPFETAQIVAILVWFRAPPMVGVDATPGAEVVLRRHGVEFVDREQFMTLENAQSFDRDGAHDRALSSTHRTRTAARVNDPIRQVELENHTTTMAARLVPWLNRRDAVTSVLYRLALEVWRGVWCYKHILRGVMSICLVCFWSNVDKCVVCLVYCGHVLCASGVMWTCLVCFWCNVDVLGVFLV